MQEMQIGSLDWEDPWRRKWQPTAVFLPGKSHGQRTPACYNPWSCKELDMTSGNDSYGIQVSSYHDYIPKILSQLFL